MLEDIYSFLRRKGYKKKGSSWYREWDRQIHIIDFQRSHFGNEIYTNLAIWLKDLGEVTYPKEQLCHIRTRLDLLCPKELEICKLLSSDFNIEDTQRNERLKSSLGNYAFPFFVEFSSEERIKKQLSTGTQRNILILKSVYEYYGLVPPKR